MEYDTSSRGSGVELVVTSYVPEGSTPVPAKKVRSLLTAWAIAFPPCWEMIGGIIPRCQSISDG